MSPVNQKKLLKKVIKQAHLKVTVQIDKKVALKNNLT
jgi:hypothetical protein